MANKATKTEHAGHKGSGRHGGFWGKRVDAKKESNRRRRENDKEEARRDTSRGVETRQTACRHGAAQFLTTQRSLYPLTAQRTAPSRYARQRSATNRFDSRHNGQSCPTHQRASRRSASLYRARHRYATRRDASQHNGYKFRFHRRTPKHFKSIRVASYHDTTDQSFSLRRDAAQLAATTGSALHRGTANRNETQR